MNDVREYGRSLFLLSEEEGITDSVSGDVAIAEQIFSLNPDYARIIDTPALTKEERVNLIDEAFSGLNVYLVNMIKILAEKHLAFSVPKALRGFSEAYDKSRGIERVEAITALPLTNSQTEALRKKLESETGKTIIISNTIDTAILGGMKLRYCGKQLDGSLKTRLLSLEESLKQTLI